ncbi:MAG: DUF389 domain-containing protein [Sciscionella sp.]
MLHLRALCPTDRTDAALRVLHAERGAAHITVSRGAGVWPEADMVEADVAREATQQVLRGLTSLGLDHEGGITLVDIDAVLSDAADAAQQAAPGDPADAVVWDELLARTGEESRLNGTFLAFLTIACLLAAVGVITDSAITIVGAMVVGPEFGPLAALAVSLVRRRWDLARRACLALGVGFPVAMLVTAAAALIAHWCGLFEPSSLSNLHEVAFIYRPGAFSIIVALLAGAAGMLSLTSAKSAVLVGVFISVTTVPAAGFAVIAAVAGKWSLCGGAVLQLFVNLVGIVLAGTVLLMIRRGRTTVDTARPLSPE